MVSLGTPVYVTVRALTNQLGNDITKGLSGSRRDVQRNGEDLGRAFTAGFSKGVDTNAFRRVSNGLRSMVPEAIGAQKAFASLVRTSYTLGTALTTIVGGASAAISALGALGGAALGAASTFAVAGNGLFALVAGMSAVKLATSGVGGALQKLKQQTAATAATSTRTALQSVRDSQSRALATRRIEDAERALARVIEDNRDRLVEANNDVAASQRDLNEALRDGREEIQQIGFDAQDAALGEKRAALELDRARQAMLRTQDLPPNNLARRAAEQAYAEAELNYRKAQDANRDLQAESARLATTGVEGLDSVIDARNRVAEAEADKAQVIKDSLQEEEDALRNVAEARADANSVTAAQDAVGGGDIGGGGVAAAGAAWDEGLNDAQRKFVLFLNSLQPKIDELQEIAANAFLPKLQQAIDTLFTRGFPTVATGINLVAGAMGNAAIILADTLTTDGNLAKFATLFESSAKLIELFGSILAQTFDAVLSILVATAPIAERFFGFINTQMTEFADHLNSVSGNAELTEFFARAEETAVKFGDIFGNIFRGIGGVIDANMGPGSGGWILLDYFSKVTSDFGNSEGMKTFFADVATNATFVFDALGSLVKVLGELGANENIGKTFEILNDPEGVAAFANILKVAADAGPAFAELVVTITKIVSALADTGAMQIFFDTLNNIFGAVLSFVSDPANKELLDFLGRIFAFFSAIGFVAGLVGVAFKVITGIVIAILGPFATLFGWLKNLLPVFALLGSYLKTLGYVFMQVIVPALRVFGAALMANPIGLLITAIGLLIGALVWFFTQTEVGKKIWKEFTRFLGEAWENIVKFIVKALFDLGGFFADTWENIVNFVEDAVDFLVDLFLNWTIYGIIIKNWDEIVQFFEDVWKNIMRAFIDAFNWIDQYVIQPMIRLGEILATAFQIMGALIGTVWDGIKLAINAAWKWIDRYIFEPIRLAVKLIQDAFEIMGLRIRTAWQLLQDALFIAFKWIDNNVFSPIRSAVYLVQQAFEQVATGIRIAWEAIKESAAKPINFVIDTVYNNGLRSFFNDVAGNLGMSLRLPRVNTIKFASGGVLPGYTPGRDVHKFYSPTAGNLHLSGGEAIMRPEWVRAVGGPAAVERMNRQARGGGGASGTGTRAFAGGGILDFGGDVLDFLGGIGKIIGDFFSNPQAAVKKHLIEGVLKPMLGNTGGGLLGELAGGAPLALAGGVVDSIKKFFETKPPAGQPAGKMGWQNMFNIVQSQFPGVRLNSGYRPGAVTVNGTPSLHGQGRAIDLAPRMDIFNWLAKTFPNSTELIHTPAGDRQLLNGRQYRWTGKVAATHYDHVHWAMAKGGTVYPTKDGSIVRVAEAGKPERVEPLDPNGLSDRDKAWAELFTEGLRGDVKIYVTQRENEDSEAFARRVADLVNNDIRMGSTH